MSPGNFIGVSIRGGQGGLVLEAGCHVLPCQGLQFLVTLCDLEAAPGFPSLWLTHLSVELVPSQNRHAPLWLLVSTRMDMEANRETGGILNSRVEKDTQAAGASGGVWFTDRTFCLSKQFAKCFL